MRRTGVLGEEGIPEPCCRQRYLNCGWQCLAEPDLGITGSFHDLDPKAALV
jgi:hypothetical protein